jgi:hypothetical protein
LEFLRELGGEIHSQATYSPVIEVTAPVGTIRKNFAQSSLLERVTESNFGKPKELAAWHSTVQLGVVDVFYHQGPPPFLGQGIRVGITGEGGNANCAVDEGNPYFFATSFTNKSASRSCTQDADCNPECLSFNNASFCDQDVCTIYHGTVVAGAIGHAAGLFPRMAPMVDVYNVNDKSSHADSLDWLMQKNVVVENESWGGPTDVYEQDRVSIIGLHIVEIAGNGGVAHYSSCHANNTLCVGGYGVNGGVFSMYNQTSSAGFAGCSRWTQGCDRETPHVVFRGLGVESTFNNLNDPDRLVDASGTSLSAPIAVGLIALMIQRWSYPFLYWPEVTRATLMASAAQDVDTPVAGKTYSDYRPPDERDGAGIPDAARIENMINQKRVMRLNLHKKDDFDAQAKKIITQVEGIEVGDRIRAVLSWTGCPNSDPDAQIGNGAHADLDLHILDPNGNRVFNAASYDGTVEIGEIVAATAGTYQFEVQRFGWAQCDKLGDRVWGGFAYDVR